MKRPSFERPIDKGAEEQASHFLKLTRLPRELAGNLEKSVGVASTWHRAQVNSPYRKSQAAPQGGTVVDLS